MRGDNFRKSTFPVGENKYYNTFKLNMSLDRIFWIQRMTVEPFRDLLSQKPFRPFRLVMSSGEAYEVRDREFAFLTRNDLVVGIGHAEDDVPAEFKICSLQNVIAVEQLQAE